MAVAVGGARATAARAPRLPAGVGRSAADRGLASAAVPDRPGPRVRGGRAAATCAPSSSGPTCRAPTARASTSRCCPRPTTSGPDPHHPRREGPRVPDHDPVGHDHPARQRSTRRQPGVGRRRPARGAASARASRPPTTSRGSISSSRWTSTRSCGCSTWPPPGPATTSSCRPPQASTPSPPTRAGSGPSSPSNPSCGDRSARPRRATCRSTSVDGRAGSDAATARSTTARRGSSAREALLEPQRVPRVVSATAVARTVQATWPTRTTTVPTSSTMRRVPRAPAGSGRLGHRPSGARHAPGARPGRPAGHRRAGPPAVRDRVDPRPGRQAPAMVRSALESRAVRLAATHPHHKELYVAAPVGERVIEGYVDLLIEKDGDLVVVDYKTDSARSEAEVDAKLAAYELQGASYAVALEAVTGQRVVECRFVFCRPSGAIERSVADLPGGQGTRARQRLRRRPTKRRLRPRRRPRVESPRHLRGTTRSHPSAASVADVARSVSVPGRAWRSASARPGCRHRRRGGSGRRCGRGSRPEPESRLALPGSERRVPTRMPCSTAATLSGGTDAVRMPLLRVANGVPGRPANHSAVRRNNGLARFTNMLSGANRMAAVGTAFSSTGISSTRPRTRSGRRSRRRG